MNVASRFQYRQGGMSYQQREGNAVPEDSSGESDSNVIRRKFQRTATDPSLPTSTDEPTFRKPSIPASATRNAGQIESRPSISQRRKSNLRENVRVPSGPREYPGSPGKLRKASTSSSTAPSVAESTNSRSYFPQQSENAGSFFYNSRMATSQTQLSFGNPNTEREDDGGDSSYSPYGGEDRSRTGSLDFLPDVNFDDFQTSIKNYDGTGSLLSEFPTVGGGRALPQETGSIMARGRGYGQQPPSQKEEVNRAPSLRQRLANGRQPSAAQQVSNAKESSALPVQSGIGSLRGRRQSSVPQSTFTPALGPPPAGPAASKPPRKSLGPGVISGVTKSNGTAAPDSSNSVKSSIARTDSTSKSARRTTLQPVASAGAELPRVSTLTATTQSRQNKVKSLQPPPRDQTQPDTNSTPNSTKSTSKISGQNRAHTPSSSGNRRQSMAASGRASGLGARTISPTDARRLKRMSVMAAPYVPGTPQEEMPNPMNVTTTNNTAPRLPELPRVAQPSPSFIPRKASNATPSSARASPSENRQEGGVSLRSKSSYQSLLNASANGSTSRLPTPKPRSARHSSGSSSSAMGQYNSGGDGEVEDSDLSYVPPVPRIPKAWERDNFDSEMAFLASSLKSSGTYSDFSDLDRDRERTPAETPALPTPWTSQTPRTSLDVPVPARPATETPVGNQSSEYNRRVTEATGHKRNNTLTDGTTSLPPVAPSAGGPAKSNQVRAQPDPNGRKNANLQPLRLPPLNLMPINTRTAQNYNANAPASLPRPSQETDARDDFMASWQTPEPKRVAKTPSTPMTASKATFYRREYEQDKSKNAIRSSSSHYALRDLMMADEGSSSKFWDEGSDGDVSAGVAIPQNGKQRSAITPFASGSLPKGSGEFARLRGRPSGEYGDEEYNAKSKRDRAQTGATVASVKSTPAAETAMNVDSEAEQEDLGKKESSEKKESGLRKRLSLGFRRSSSKSASRAEIERQENEKDAKAKNRWDMPPPKLPASATWTGDVPALPPSSRPSFDSLGGNGHARKRSQVPTSVSTTSLLSVATDEAQSAGNGVKTRSQHSEQPTPVTATPTSAAARASSWGNLGSNILRGVGAGSNGKPPTAAPRHRLTPSTISAIVKDKDDLAADDEMHRLSRKRKDVDSAARESEELKKRAIAQSPRSAESVLHDRSLIGGSVLNVFERGEVVDHEKDGIYFTGTKSVRKIIGSLSSSTPTMATSGDKNAAAQPGGSNNYGYDDERGDYNIILGDHLAYRYEVVDVLGKGSFGQVVRCVDHRDGGVVAVKIIRNKKRFHQQALVEVGILGKLREWDPEGSNATLSITTSFYFRSHLCIVTPCLSINLYELIRAHNFTGFALPLIRRFARQLLACLTLLQTKRIIHCDLKPENILLCEARKADVRVIDFGSSCREEEKVYTYIQSRFYRSPEVILGSSYGLGIDMWSLGCILAELWTGYPIFPGENEQEQLACIMEIFGPPDKHLVERCTRKKLFFDSVGKPRVTVSSKGRRRRPSSKTLAQALKTEDEAFVDFIARCLRWDPDRRMKPAEAVGHPFITNMAFHQQRGAAAGGIPDEARRAARVRTNAAVPAAAANGQSIPSPVKRGPASSTSSATTAATPAKARPIVETPQTALRSTAAANNAAATSQGSPVKTAGSVNRRHSTVQTAGGMAGNKRASNGIVLPSGSLPGGPQQQARNGSGNLAQMAASASMGAAAAKDAGQQGRWRG